jgi:hypothetical protein
MLWKKRTYGALIWAIVSGMMLFFLRGSNDIIMVLLVASFFVSTYCFAMDAFFNPFFEKIIAKEDKRT